MQVCIPVSLGYTQSTEGACPAAVDSSGASQATAVMEPATLVVVGWTSRHCLLTSVSVVSCSVTALPSQSSQVTLSPLQDGRTGQLTTPLPRTLHTASNSAYNDTYKYNVTSNAQRKSMSMYSMYKSYLCI